jgi:hypothetical protein
VAEGEAFWATVSTLAARFLAKSPDGMTGVVEIETADGRKIVPSVLQRYPPWIIFEVAEPDADSAKEILFVREQDVRGIQMRYERGKQRLGFTIGEVSPD